MGVLRTGLVVVCMLVGQYAFAKCGNHRCEAGENCSTCPADCGCTMGLSCVSGSCEAVCGNGYCAGANENCNTCPADCGCASGTGCAYFPQSSWYACTACGSTTNCNVDPSGPSPCDPCTQSCDCAGPS